MLKVEATPDIVTHAGTVHVVMTKSDEEKDNRDKNTHNCFVVVIIDRQLGRWWIISMTGQRYRTINKLSIVNYMMMYCTVSMWFWPSGSRIHTSDKTNFSCHHTSTKFQPWTWETMCGAWGDIFRWEGEYSMCQNSLVQALLNVAM